MESESPPNSYIKQIAIYLQQEEYAKAKAHAKKFTEKYPESMPAHFLLAKSSFWLNDFKTAREEAQKAFNLSKGQDELAITGILLACSYYQLKEYEKGLGLLALLKTKLSAQENVMKLRFVFALALHDEPAAMRHLEELHSMNRREATALISKFLKESRE